MFLNKPRTLVLACFKVFLGKSPKDLFAIPFVTPSKAPSENPTAKEKAASAILKSSP